MDEPWSAAAIYYSLLDNKDFRQSLGVSTTQGVPRKQRDPLLKPLLHSHNAFELAQMRQQRAVPNVSLRENDPIALVNAGVSKNLFVIVATWSSPQGDERRQQAFFSTHPLIFKYLPIDAMCGDGKIYAAWSKSWRTEEELMVSWWLGAGWQQGDADYDLPPRESPPLQYQQLIADAREITTAVDLNEFIGNATFNRAPIDLSKFCAPVSAPPAPKLAFGANMPTLLSAVRFELWAAGRNNGPVGPARKLLVGRENTPLEDAEMRQLLQQFSAKLTATKVERRTFQFYNNSTQMEPFRFSLVYIGIAWSETSPVPLVEVTIPPGSVGDPIKSIHQALAVFSRVISYNYTFSEIIRRKGKSYYRYNAPVGDRQVGDEIDPTASGDTRVAVALSTALPMPFSYAYYVDANDSILRKLIGFDKQKLAELKEALDKLRAVQNLSDTDVQYATGSAAADPVRSVYEMLAHHWGLADPDVVQAAGNVQKIEYLEEHSVPASLVYDKQWPRTIAAEQRDFQLLQRVVLVTNKSAVQVLHAAK